jgi:hypothetical protein
MRAMYGRSLDLGGDDSGRRHVGGRMDVVCAPGDFMPPLESLDVPSQHARGAMYFEESRQLDRLNQVLYPEQAESPALLLAQVPDVDVQHLQLVVLGRRVFGATVRLPIDPLWRSAHTSGAQHTMSVYLGSQGVAGN